VETSSVTIEDDSISHSPEDHEDCDTPEVAALKLEFSTLSTSYSSLQNTVQHLQTQVADLQRVNNQLQDENESYNILLCEKTMAGQFDVLKQLYSTASGDHDDDAERNIDGRSIRSTARSTLGRVSELDELETTEEEARHETDDFDPFTERPPSGASKRRTRSGATSPIPHGESLAGLPLTGPGLDLAAELGRAENRDGLDIPLLDAKESPAKSKPKRITRLAESADRSEEVNSLRNEVKSLKDANKALSLYASKILDRIIAQEGFEHVLAVDYKEQLASPVDQSPKPSKKLRPQSALFSLGNTLTNSPKPGTSAREATSSSTGSTSALSPADESKRQRRSMSFDWRSLSSWGSSDKKPEPKNLRPLTLRPGATQIVGAKKLDTEEDDDDRKERERLAATMKLMGIDPAPRSPQVATDSGNWSSKPDATSEKSSSNATSANRRWSFFRSGNAPAPVVESSKLTENALQQAEASETLRQLDEKERSKIEYMAKGAGGGYTEPRSRRSVSDEWRNRRDARHANGSSGSASTIWSAGISNKDDRGTKNSVHDSP
jgi:FtsZ-binding cell division protein ZapB